MSIDIAGLAARIRGRVFAPEDPGYDELRAARNGMHDRRPCAIVQARDDADVITAVAFAREERLPLSVRGGNHSVPGYGTCDDGIVLDLSPIRWVRVEPDRRRARVGGGALLGDLDHATQAFGLATPLGFISTTGVAGLTLGGGIGAYLTRKHGLTCDNLLSADVVTADGRLVRASEEENADLFWALRGGGGNFGVVTSMELQLHPVSTVVGGPMFFELEGAADLMRTWTHHIGSAPRELGGFFGFHMAPPLPFIPEERHGDRFALVVASWSGDPDEAMDVIEPIRRAAPLAAEHVGAMPYHALQSAFDALIPPGLRHYWKSDFARTLPDEAIARHVEHGSRVPNVHATMHLYPLGGAVSEVPSSATAYAHRDAAWAVNVAGMWPEAAEDERTIAWVRDYYAAVHPYSGYEGGYTNFMAGDDEQRVRENYGPNFERLQRVKAAWDPENLFRLNQNIPPLAAAVAA